MTRSDSSGDDAERSERRNQRRLTLTAVLIRMQSEPDSAGAPSEVGEAVEGSGGGVFASYPWLSRVCGAVILVSVLIAVGGGFAVWGHMRNAAADRAATAALAAAKDCVAVTQAPDAKRWRPARRRSSSVPPATSPPRRRFTAVSWLTRIRRRMHRLKSRICGLRWNGRIRTGRSTFWSRCERSCPTRAGAPGTGLPLAGANGVGRRNLQSGAYGSGEPVTGVSDEAAADTEPDAHADTAVDPNTAIYTVVIEGCGAPCPGKLAIAGRCVRGRRAPRRWCGGRLHAGRLVCPGVQLGVVVVHPVGRNLSLLPSPRTDWFCRSSPGGAWDARCTGSRWYATMADRSIRGFCCSGT